MRNHVTLVYTNMVDGAHAMIADQSQKKMMHKNQANYPVVYNQHWTHTIWPRPKKVYKTPEEMLAMDN